MDIGTFKKEATKHTDRYPSRLNPNTEIQEVIYRVGPFTAVYLCYNNLITGNVNARKRQFKVNGKGVSRKAFYKAIENI